MIMSNASGEKGVGVADEIAEANDQMLLAMRQWAQADPAQASLLFGVDAATLSSIADMSRTDIRKIANSRISLFGLRIDGNALQNLAREHSERIPVLVALQATGRTAS